MEAQIKHIDTTKEYYFEEGCYINELCNSNEDPDVSIARARVLPGETTHWHRLHNTVERYAILQGQGEVEIGQLPPTTVRQGDVVLIPAGCRQRIRNIGETELVFLAICSPRFQPDAYEDIEHSPE
jgi:mannose-6-phosphate isomerase-like protein (cupin superfamily)